MKMKSIKDLKRLHELMTKEERNKELSLSLGIAAHLNTLDDIMFARGEYLKNTNIHEYMRMWQKLHNRYFYGNDTGYESLKNEQSMSAEDKDLILRDICARLPYNIIVRDEYGDYIEVNIYTANLEHLIDRVSTGIVKMVLRPLSSMTEEEAEEYCNNVTDIGSGVDWLNKNMFDFRGLIPKDLAISTEEFNPY